VPGLKHAIDRLGFKLAGVTCHFSFLICLYSATAGVVDILYTEVNELLFQVHNDLISVISLFQQGRAQMSMRTDVTVGAFDGNEDSFLC
jgi:hypothetical protein